MKAFDERIEKAVSILWCDRQLERGREAMELLEEAAEEGHGDACYFLARCYAGPSYVDAGFGFPENDEKAYQYLDMSIEQGSAVGMFGARRFGGYKPKGGSFIHAPYESSREIWEEVCAIANSGEKFIKYLVANAYYYGDVAQLTEVDFASETNEQIDNQFKKWAETAIDMYEELLEQDMIMGISNYIDIITSGDYGVPKNKKRAKELELIGAQKGLPYYMVKVGQELEGTQAEKSKEYYEKALRHRQTIAGYYLGKLYTLGGKLPRNLKKARDYFEDCLACGTEIIGCHNHLGEIYFYGGDGIEADYQRAVFHLLEACSRGNYWGSDMLGTCYLKGLGISKDYGKALEELSRYPGETLSAIGLGEIYAYGLGVAIDIKKAMNYWNAFPKHPAVMENKKNFKRTLFGWKRKME